MLFPSSPSFHARKHTLAAASGPARSQHPSCTHSYTWPHKGMEQTMAGGVRALSCHGQGHTPVRTRRCRQVLGSFLPDLGVLFSAVL